MNILVTAGNSLAPIDKVRCISNIFTGRTGAAIALQGHATGHGVTLLTSHPEVVAALHQQARPPEDRWVMHVYRTFEELHDLMSSLIQKGELDVVIHCAAVSDYLSNGIYAREEGTSFDDRTGLWHGAGGRDARLVDRQAGKVKSNEEELWLRLRRAPKLVDFIRSPWGFAGILVKFKLEVGLDEKELLRVAERSRQDSQADLMVANTLEESAHHASIGPVDGAYQAVTRRELPVRLLQVVEQLVEERRHG